MFAQGSTPQFIDLAQLYQVLKSLGKGLCTLTSRPQSFIFVRTIQFSGPHFGWMSNFDLKVKKFEGNGKRFEGPEMSG